MANEIITTLHPDQDPDTNLYPNIKGANIPDGSINRSKLDDNINGLLDNIGELHPSGVDTSSNILSKTSDDGIWVGSDTGKWYYWDGSHYIEGGIYLSNVNVDGDWIATGVDLNNYTETGNYLLSRGVIFDNCPISIYDIKILNIIKYIRTGSSYTYQMIRGLVSDKTFYRYYFNDVWSDWFVFKFNYNIKNSGSIDCNDLKDNGKTLIFSGLSVFNKPSNVNLPMVIEVENYVVDTTTTYIQQIAYNVTDGVKYVRHYYKGYDNVWSNWSIFGITNILSSVLNNKYIMAIGDSMVYGHTLGPSKTWLAKMCNRVRANAINKGINGTRITNNNSDSIYARICDSSVSNYITDSADYILVFGGTNDINHNVTLGTINSTDPNEFYGSLNLICENLQTRYPLSHIGFITPYNYNSDCEIYINAIKEVCAKYGIKVFNNMIDGGIDYNNATQHNALFMENDTTHLNENGHNWVSYKYQSFIESL